MKIKIKDIVNVLESVAHPSLQESYDNSGLLTGNPEDEVTKILISLDCTEEVVSEAVSKGCNMIVSHHPIIFKGLKKLTGSNYVERTVIKAVKNNIALYAGHTNFDNIFHNGVNQKIAQKLGLHNLRILAPKKERLCKMVVFVPEKHLEDVLKAAHDAGAGKIGDYQYCGYYAPGIGQFMPKAGADPYIGTENKLEKVSEHRAEFIFPSYLTDKIIASVRNKHPYEEPAYDIILLENINKEVGAGMIGEFPEALNEQDFLLFLKEKLNLKYLMHTKLPSKKIKKTAFCGGSGSFLLRDAIRQGADAFVSADFKYHEFFDAEDKILIADVGHYETEVCTKELFFEVLSEKFSNIALVLSEINTNPIHYL